MESFQKRARERRMRERQAEKQARRQDRNAASRADRAEGEGTPADPASNPPLPGIPSAAVAPPLAPKTANPST